MSDTNTSNIGARFRRKFAANLDTLSTRRDFALSSFRTVVQELADVNRGLEQQEQLASETAAAMSQQADSIRRQIQDNELIRSKILDIIGE